MASGQLTVSPRGSDPFPVEPMYRDYYELRRTGEIDQLPFKRSAWQKKNDKKIADLKVDPYWEKYFKVFAVNWRLPYTGRGIQPDDMERPGMVGPMDEVKDEPGYNCPLERHWDGEKMVDCQEENDEEGEEDDECSVHDEDGDSSMIESDEALVFNENSVSSAPALCPEYVAREALLMITKQDLMDTAAQGCKVLEAQSAEIRIKVEEKDEEMTDADEGLDSDDEDFPLINVEPTTEEEDITRDKHLLWNVAKPYVDNESVGQNT